MISRSSTYESHIQHILPTGRQSKSDKVILRFYSSRCSFVFFVLCRAERNTSKKQARFARELLPKSSTIINYYYTCLEAFEHISETYLNPRENKDGCYLERYEGSGCSEIYCWEIEFVYLVVLKLFWDSGNPNDKKIRDEL